MNLLNKKKVKPQKDQEQQKTEELQRELQEVQKSLERAYENFSYVVEPELIDCCIYELNAGQMRYQFLMKQMKNQKADKKDLSIS